MIGDLGSGSRESGWMGAGGTLSTMVAAAGSESRHESRPLEEPDEGLRAPAADTPSNTGPDDPSEVLAELRDVVAAYFRQEAVDPLKRLLVWLGFGLAGGILLCTGLVLLALAGLRALQTETGGHLAGSLSWTPYAIVLAGVLVVFGVARSAARARRRETGEPAE